MKARLIPHLSVALLGFFFTAELRAKDTAFTFQGQLTENGIPITGACDLVFSLYDALTDGSPVGPSVTNPAVAVSNGLFTVMLDFGEGVFTGDPRWLEIGVLTNGGGTGYLFLAPRQRMAAAPYALYAASAGTATAANSAAVAATAPWDGLTGVPSGFADGVDSDTTYGVGIGLERNGTVFSLNTVFTDGRYWRLGGNLGTSGGPDYLGTVDGQPLELKVNSQRALRLEPTDLAPNLIGGWSDNLVAGGVQGATIGGGRKPEREWRRLHQPGGGGCWDGRGRHG